MVTLGTYTAIKNIRVFHAENFNQGNLLQKKKTFKTRKFNVTQEMVKEEPVENQSQFVAKATTDDEDETVFERILALKEMIPESIVNGVSNIVGTTFNIICDASWILFTSCFILIGPVIFEHERIRYYENSDDVKENSESKK